MWSVLLVAVLLLVYAYGMARGSAWLDRCSDDEFRLLIWEAEPHRTAEAVGEHLNQVLVIHVWATEPGCVWLRVEGWILFPWSRKLERICWQYLGDPQTRLILDLGRIRWISPGGYRLLRALDPHRVHIQRWPRHLRPLCRAAGGD
ncbi:MAG: hypothetical protein ACE5I9_01770 [Candidatus Methylomirabilales bacterium]